MSGPVFVVDANNQPLMPVAAAHARKLLHGDKARHYPHHTLTIVQLSRFVERPILRPILLGIAIYRRVAELFIVAAGPRKNYPLLYVVVDLPERQNLHRYRWRHQGWRAGSRILDIGSAIAALTLFLPISHLVILHSSPRPIATSSEYKQLQRYLSDFGLPIVLAHRSHGEPAGIPSDLYATLVRFATHPEQHTVPIVAKATPPSYHAARIRRMFRSTSEQKFLGIAAVRTPPMTGIIDPDSPLDETMLQVPVAASATGVSWQRVRIPPGTQLQHWPLGPLELLPLASLGEQSTVITGKQSTSQ